LEASRFSAEGKFNIVLESLQGDRSINEICREYGIAQSLFYKWRDKFFKGARETFPQDAAQNKSGAVRRQNKFEIRHLKQIIGELTVENQILKTTRIIGS